MTLPSGLAPWTIDFGPRPGLAPDAPSAPPRRAGPREDGQPDFFTVFQDHIQPPLRRSAPEREAPSPARAEAIRGGTERADVAPSRVRSDAHRASGPSGTKDSPAAAGVRSRGESDPGRGPARSSLEGSRPEARPIGTQANPALAQQGQTPALAATGSTGSVTEMAAGSLAQPRGPVEPSLPLMGTEGGGIIGGASASTEAGGALPLLATDGQAVQVEDATFVAEVQLRAPDLDDLAPEMRERVLRVIERMRSEYGHNVTLVEAYRSQERQNALYAQGRSAPGPVVTWTENSMHTRGLAVDVMVDGSWAPHEGYQRLHRIAAEEGLRTLWPADPGHLQMDEGASPLQGSQPEGGLARIAEVARRASPGSAAVPATAATPATPALAATGGETAVPAQPAIPATPASVPSGTMLPTGDTRAEQGERTALRASQGEATNAGDSAPMFAWASSAGEGDSLSGGEDDGRRQRRTHAAPSRATGETSAAPGGFELPSAAPAQAIEALAAAFDEGSVRVGASTAPEALHRVTQVRELQELSYPRRLGQMTLRMMDGMDEAARMRVRMGASGIDASIGVRDLLQADGMRSRIGVLERALQARGLENVAVRVSALGTGPGSELSALTTSAVTSGRGGQHAEHDASHHGHRQQTGRGFEDHDPNARRQDRGQGTPQRQDES